VSACYDNTSTIRYFTDDMSLEILLQCVCTLLKFCKIKKFDDFTSSFRVGINVPGSCVAKCKLPPVKTTAKLN